MGLVSAIRGWSAFQGILVCHVHQMRCLGIWCAWTYANPPCVPCTHWSLSDKPTCHLLPCWSGNRRSTCLSSAPLDFSGLPHPSLFRQLNKSVPVIPQAFLPPSWQTKNQIALSSISSPFHHQIEWGHICLPSPKQ